MRVIPYRFDTSVRKRFAAAIIYPGLRAFSALNTARISLGDAPGFYIPRFAAEEPNEKTSK